MSSRSAYDATARRLEEYGLFSDSTIKNIANFAKEQQDFITYKEFFTSIGLDGPVLFVNEKGEGVPVVDIDARQKPEVGVIVIHLPMANPLDENQLYQVATIAATNPAFRVIAFGNPSGKPYSYKSQNRSLLKLIGIASLHNTRPLVSVELDYLQENGIRNAHHVGYSYGAHKALIVAQYLSDLDISSIILIDPVAHPRGIKQLIHDFKNTFHPMGKYVDRTEDKLFLEARRDAAKTKHHDGALRRPINIAIGFVMKRLDFTKTLNQVVTDHPSIRPYVAWGSKSELGNDAHMKVSLHQLTHDNPGRVRSFRLNGDAHALANDIHLHAAIVQEALLDSAKA